VIVTVVRKRSLLIAYPCRLRACAWFALRGLRVERVLTDNAKVYRVGRHWGSACAELEIGRRFTRSGCPWTNGKAERFNRTLQTEFAYARAWFVQYRAAGRSGRVGRGLQHSTSPLRPRRLPADQSTGLVDNVIGHYI
jgi:transposase InsO family protein